ncbi:hypothetical protein pb186bvf_004285 [Paramecium bursaria]
MSAKGTLIPAKFLTLTSQLIVTLVIYSSKYKNVAGYPSNAPQVVDSGTSFCVAFLCFELLSLFLGFTDDFHKNNFIQILLHSLGTVITIWYILSSWKYDLIWMIWSFFCFLPMVFEVLSLSGAYMFHRVHPNTY